MKFVKSIMIIVSTIFLIGCSGNEPKFSDYQKNDSAYIQGDLGNFFEIVFSNSANLGIIMIDNVRVNSLPRTFKVSPGKHSLTVYANTAHDSAGNVIEVVLKPKNKYKLIAKSGRLGEEFFTIYLYNITKNEEGNLLKKYKIKANGHI